MGELMELARSIGAEEQLHEAVMILLLPPNYTGDYAFKHWKRQDNGSWDYIGPPLNKRT